MARPALRSPTSLRPGHSQSSASATTATNPSGKPSTVRCFIPPSTNSSERDAGGREPTSALSLCDFRARTIPATPVGMSISVSRAKTLAVDSNDYSAWRVNVTSRGRALLMLFLFSDVGESDAPTRIRPGSHLDMARLLEPAGEAGMSHLMLDEIGSGRPEVVATGEAGAVYLCHPFLVHAAQMHRGSLHDLWRNHRCTRPNRSGLSERTAIIRRLRGPSGKPCRRAGERHRLERGPPRSS